MLLHSATHRITAIPRWGDLALVLFCLGFAKPKAAKDRASHFEKLFSPKFRGRKSFTGLFVTTIGSSYSLPYVVGVYTSFIKKRCN